VKVYLKIEVNQGKGKGSPETARLNQATNNILYTINEKNRTQHVRFFMAWSVIHLEKGKYLSSMHSKHL